MSKVTLQGYKCDAIQAAKDLCYGEKVIERLREAKTEGEIARIMITARRERDFE